MTVPFPNSAPPSSNSSILSSLSRTEPKRYRQAREFPYRLRSSTSVYLEDRQFVEGFTLLNNILVAGLSTPDAPDAFVPPPSYFELAATLVVHPQYTIRAKSEEDARASDEALRYLRDTCKTVGPVNANLASAFAFRNGMQRRGSPSRLRNQDGEGASATEDEDEDDGQLRSAFCAGKSVFAQKQDHPRGPFWKIVGWAFNCSVRYRKRWERWRLWLDVMCEVLTEDFTERALAIEEQCAAVGSNLGSADALYREALIIQYLRDFRNRSQRREFMNAILANGDEGSMSAFPEIWKDETKERKVKEEVKFEQRKTINLDEGEWGDYDINEDEDEVMQGDEDEEEEAEVDDGEDFGGIESINLRQRFLILLATVATTVPSQFTTLDELFDMYTEFLRPLPLPIFSQFLATSPFPAEYQVALLTNTILPLLPTSHKPPNIFDMTQAQLIRDFLPYPANGNRSPENAKMSLLIEHLLLNMWSCGRLTPSPALTSAVSKGIAAREAKAIGNAKRKDKSRDAEERNAKAMLDMSAERIRLTLEMLEAETQGAGAGGGANKVVTSFSSEFSDLTELGTQEVEDGDVTIVG